MATGSYAELWDWSVDEPAAFWDSIWDYFGVLGQRGDGPALTGGSCRTPSGSPAPR